MNQATINRATSMLRETFDAMRSVPDVARGVFLALGLQNSPLSRRAIILASDWQSAVLSIAAVSGMDWRVIEEEVTGLGLHQLDTIYQRICAGEEPHRVIAAVQSSSTSPS